MLTPSTTTGDFDTSDNRLFNANISVNILVTDEFSLVEVNTILRCIYIDQFSFILNIKSGFR